MSDPAVAELNRALLCPDCLADRFGWAPPTPPGQKDARCRHCGAELCANHIVPHLRERHHVEATT